MDRREILERLVRFYPEAIGAGGGSAAQDWIGSGPGSKFLSYGPLFHAGCPRDKHGGLACGGWNERRTRRLKCCSPFIELERCLGILREDSRSAHLFGRYWCPPGAEVRREVRFTRKSRDRLEPILPAHSEVKAQGGATSSKLLLDCVLHTWPSWVLDAEVNAQLSKLSALYRGTPFLPLELLQAA